jgi:hypothetical protein
MKGDLDLDGISELVLLESTGDITTGNMLASLYFSIANISTTNDLAIFGQSQVSDLLPKRDL